MSILRGLCANGDESKKINIVFADNNFSLKHKIFKIEVNGIHLAAQSKKIAC